MMSEAGRLAGCPFASASATSMTSEGYVGGKLDDIFKALVLKAGGDVHAARYGIGLIDEWDKKATRFAGGRDGLTTTSLQTEVLVPMQGAEFPILGKRAMERPVMFNSHGTFFCFAGAFAGLDEIMRRQGCGSSIGFSATQRTRRQSHVLDAVLSYGYVREWVNRLSGVIFVPSPKISSLERAAAGTVLDSFNALVGELGIVLFPHGAAVAKMAAYAMESRTYYRGIKSVWWSIVQLAVATGQKGTVLVGGAEADDAISRVATGCVGLPEATPQADVEECNANQGDGCASVGA
jgi:ATP-dependent Clp protease ATP-binding subunit ClpX